LSGAVVSGASGRSFEPDPVEEVLIIGVHFKPGGAFPFLGLPAGDLADTHVDLEALWGPSAGLLRERLCEARSSAERFQLLQEALRARFCRSLEQHCAVSAALEMFGKNQAGPRVKEAAKYLGLSQRRFIQVFKAEVCMTPKLFSRIQRFQQTRTFIQQNLLINWANLAVDLGYFDQSHFMRDFFDVAALSATDYINRHTHFIERNIRVKRSRLPHSQVRSILSNTETHPLLDNWRESMKRTFGLIIAALAAVALFAGLVHAVLVLANVSEPAATTVYGMTPRRLWATTAALLALIGVVIGGLALRQSTGRIGTH